MSKRAREIRFWLLLLFVAVGLPYACGSMPVDSTMDLEQVGGTDALTGG